LSAARARGNASIGAKLRPSYSPPTLRLFTTPRGLAKSGGLFGLDGFLREHYMTSRETARAMSTYLRGLDSGPAPARASKRAARGDDNAKLNEKKKPASKPAR